MAFLKLNELHGGPIIVNMNKVELTTDAGAGQAKLWFGGADVDSMTVKESFDDVERMLDVALTGYPGVVSADIAAMVMSENGH